MVADAGRDRTRRMKSESYIALGETYGYFTDSMVGLT